MKCLVLKDLYNISYNVKSMVFTLLLLAAIQILYLENVGAFIITASILCSMMIVTTFSFDERSGWNRYAIVMPLGKSDLVAAKFVVHFVFAGIGVVFGIVVGFLGNVIAGKWTWDPETGMAFAMTALAALAISLVYGGVLIPLAIRFGTEKSRVFTAVAALGMSGLVVSAGVIASKLGIVFHDRLVVGLICISPIAALAWDYGMYVVSCRIYERMEVLR